MFETFKELKSVHKVFEEVSRANEPLVTRGENQASISICH